MVTIPINITKEDRNGIFGRRSITGRLDNVKTMPKYGFLTIKITRIMVKNNESIVINKSSTMYFFHNLSE